MSSLGLALILGSAFGYSFADLLRKRLTSRLSAWVLLALLSVGMLPVLLIWWQLGEGGGLPTSGYWLPAVVSAALNIVANLAFLTAIRVSPLSVTIPMLSLTPAFTALASIYLLNEVPSRQGFLGIGFVVVGVFLLSLRASSRRNLRSFLGQLSGEWGVFLMVGVSLLWAITAPLDKVAMRAAPASFHGLALNAMIGAVAVCVVLLRGEGRQLATLRGSRMDLLGTIAATLVGISLQLVALGFVWAAMVETLKRAIGSFLALVFGAVFFRERVGWRKVAAVAMMGVGLVLLLLS